MDYVKLTDDKLDINEISELVSHESCGAVSLFVGTTRDNFDGKQVVSLEYEAYSAMALKAMKSICKSIREKWSDIKHIAIYHRLGLVGVKEASIVVALSSPHRVESMEAVQFAMEHLKAKVPIWKKEIYKVPDQENNSSQWKENKESVESPITKKPKLDIFAPYLKEVKDDTPAHLLQINVDNTEIHRRIKSFMAQKRVGINELNISQFVQTNSEFSCARINAVYSKKHSHGHIRVHRVVNEVGPQDVVPVANNENLTSEPKNNGKEELSSAVLERIQNCEIHLNVTKPVSKDIYERLKSLENRILDLESISPEYPSFWNFNIIQNKCNDDLEFNKKEGKHITPALREKTLKYKQKRNFSMEDLDLKIAQLKQHIYNQII